MCEHFGYDVVKLERTRIMNVSLSGIPLGEWRDLTDDELIDLFKLIENSSSEAKPKTKAKPKTAGIKRPVVKMEKTRKAYAGVHGKRFTSPGHPAGTFELLHVTEGGLTLTVEETVTQVAAGASAVAKTEAAHGYANEGENVLRFTMTVAEFHR